MPSISDLAQALALQAKTQGLIQESDPYLQAESPFAKIGQEVLNNSGQLNPDGSQRYSAKDRILTSLLAGLGQGVFSGLSKDYQGRAQTAYNDVLQQTADGNAPTVAPSVLGADLFASAKGTGDLFRATQEKDLENSKIQAQQLIDRSIAIANAKKEHKTIPALAQKTIKDLAGTTAAIAALNANDERIKGLTGGDTLGGGVINWAEKYIPGTASYQYEKGLPFLADPLTVGLSGSSRQGILQKTLDSLSLGAGQTPKSMLDISNQARQAMVDKAQSNIDLLKESGVLAPDALQAYQDKLDAARLGTLSDHSIFGDSPSSSSPAVDQIKQEIASLMSAGKTKAEAVAAVRAAHTRGAPIG